MRSRTNLLEGSNSVNTTAGGSGGTTNTIAMFTGAQTIGDSLITQQGTSSITMGAVTYLPVGGIGTLTNIPLNFKVNNSTRWFINDTLFDFTPISDNAYDIGQSSVRARNIFSVIGTFGSGTAASAGAVRVALGGAVGFKEGTNATQGVVTLSGAGTAVVYTTAYSATARIWLTPQAVMGTQGTLKITTTTTSVQFTIASSSATDQSVVGWFISESS